MTTYSPYTHQPAPRPITREEFDSFLALCEEEANKPPRREPFIIVHPRDLKAVKTFFGQK